MKIFLNNILLVCCFILFSCSKEEFATQKKIEGKESNPRAQNTNSLCADSRLVRPPVDLLFVWDNSTSSVFINPETKEALNNLVNTIAPHFDYHILLAPLLGTGNASSYFLSYDDALKPGNGITKISKSQASNILDSFPKNSGAIENGMERVRGLIANNQSNGVFRKNSYTIVVVMSNGDDNSWCTNTTGRLADICPGINQNMYTEAKSHDLLCLRGHYTSGNLYHSTFSTYDRNCSNAPSLNASMFRFMAISGLSSQNECYQNIGTRLKENYVYSRASNYLYIEPYTNDFNQNDQSMRNFGQGENNDSYNICISNFKNIFDGVNNAIQDVVIAHTYRYWPVARKGINIDSSTLNIHTSSGKSLDSIDDNEEILRDLEGKEDRDQSGFRVSGYRYIQEDKKVNTRFLPDEGESFEGKVVELFGDAKITFPECLIVNFKTEHTYFGYIHMEARPLESSIQVIINSITVPKGSDGWVLEKSGEDPLYQSDKNMRVSGPSDFSERNPAIKNSGYFIKLAPRWIYSEEDTIKILYDPIGV